MILFLIKMVIYLTEILLIKFNHEDKVVTIKKIQFPKYDLLYRIQNIIKTDLYKNK